MNLKKYYITIINELFGKLTNFVGNWRTLTNFLRWNCRFIDDPCEFKDTPAESLNWQRLTCEICSDWVVDCCDHVPAWWLFLASPMSPLRFLDEFKHYWQITCEVWSTCTGYRVYPHYVGGSSLVEFASKFQLTASKQREREREK